MRRDSSSIPIIFLKMFPRCSVNTWTVFGVSLGDLRCTAAALEHFERLMGNRWALFLIYMLPFLHFTINDTIRYTVETPPTPASGTVTLNATFPHMFSCQFSTRLSQSGN